MEGGLAGLSQAGIVGPQAGGGQQAGFIRQDRKGLAVLPGNFLVNVPFLQGFGPAARQAELIASLAGAEDQGEGYGVLGNVPLVFLLGGRSGQMVSVISIFQPLSRAKVPGPVSRRREKARGMAEEGQRTS